jgi:hypothetical protein
MRFERVDSFRWLLIVPNSIRKVLNRNPSDSRDCNSKNPIFISVFYLVLDCTFLNSPHSLMEDGHSSFTITSSKSSGVLIVNLGCSVALAGILERRGAQSNHTLMIPKSLAPLISRDRLLPTIIT